MTIQLESVSDAALALLALNGYREQLSPMASGHFRKRPVSGELDALQRLRELEAFWQRTWGDRPWIPGEHHAGS